MNFTIGERWFFLGEESLDHVGLQRFHLKNIAALLHRLWLSTLAQACAVGERLAPYSALFIASRAAEAIAGEVVVIVAIIVPFIAGRASVPA